MVPRNSTRRLTVPAHSSQRAGRVLRYTAGGVARPILQLLMRGRRSRRKSAVDVGTVVVLEVVPIITVLFFEFYLTEPNSTRTRRQNVPVHKIRRENILLLRNCLLGITVPTGLSRPSHQLQLGRHKKKTGKLRTALECISSVITITYSQLVQLSLCFGYCKCVCLPACLIFSNPLQ